MCSREMATGLHSLQHWLIPAATRLVNIAAAAGLSPLVSSARRSHAQQALLYRRFLAGQSRFPAAPPGRSAHELGLAFDLWVNDESQLEDLGTVWEQWGGVWGGHFHDPIHFEAGGAPKSNREPPPPQPEAPFEQLKGYMNAVAGFAAPLPVMAAQEAIQALPPSGNEYIERAERIITDPVGTVLEPWAGIGSAIAKRFGLVR